MVVFRERRADISARRNEFAYRHAALNNLAIKRGGEHLTCPAAFGSLSTTFVDQALLELNKRVTVDDYDRCKATLLAEGRIRRGKGRGGAVCRASVAGPS